MAIFNASIVGAAANDVPDAGVLKRMEAGLKLPAGAAPLDSYDRYYAYATRNGRKVLLGVLINARTFPDDEQSPSIHIMNTENDLPRVHDGGCMVISIVLDPVEPHNVKVSCNGVA